MKELLIIGARGFGRETYNMALESVGYGTEFIVKGFLDDNSDALNSYQGYPAILCSVEEYNICTDDVFICALGDPYYKRKYVEMMASKGGTFINIIHRTAIIGRNTTMGTGCIISQNVHISCDVSIGNYVTILPKAVVGHDASIKDYCHLGAISFMGGFSKMNEESVLHTSAILLPHKEIDLKAVAGAGSMVYKNVKSNQTVFGNPAQEL